MSDPVIQEIKSRLDIVPFIQGYVKLSRAGINWKGLCPFHSEKTPSFIVSPTRQTWHCFGCSKGGDAFKFVMELENVEFRDALKTLAERTGVELVREDPRLRTERERMYAVMEEATKFYQSQLKKVPAVVQYLRLRGLKDETMSNFRIGYAPDAWDELSYHLRAKNYTFAEMVSAGLCIRSEKRRDSYYDRFRNRIMFPIFDVNGKVIAFSGRIFESGRKTDEAKYVNSPQTMVYDKSRVLFGLDRAKDAIRKKNRCIVVEGQMDLIMSHQAGLTETIAVSGTAMTDKHLINLKRYTDTLISSFDADEAGETATRRSLDLAAAYDFNRRVAVIPKGKDPADAILEDPKIWQAAVEGSKSLMDFYCERATQKYNLKTAESKKDFSRYLLPEVAKIENEIERAHWISKIAGTLGIKEEAVWAELRRYLLAIDGNASNRIESTKPGRLKTQQLEERILGALFLYPEARVMLKEHDTSLLFAISPHGEIIKVFETGPQDEVSDMLERLPEEWRTYVDRIIFEVESLFSNIKDSRVEIAACIREVERERLKERLTLIAESINEAERSGDEERVGALLHDFKDASEKLRSLEKR
ncbi:MAG: DNA primase [Candidatus Sungbacteria bacterium]|uniref:DNA primase n=1 Tax=Candidatus Sungiibacteriota bacterium TaxID=2750080 RepID=A0A9D6LQF7_9BACT|nr:DNA primase [Candidatus Sungbacteria bacterium]